MKKNQLYTINRFNRRGLTRNSNVFDDGGGIQLTTPEISPYIDWSNPLQRAAAIDTSARLVNGFSSIANTTNPFSNSGTSPVQTTIGSDIGSGSKGIIKNPALFAQGVAGAASAVGNLAGGAIADGYSAGSGVGAVTSAIQSINTGNPVIDGIKNVGVGILGGVFNRGFGTKENKGNTAFIKANTNAAKVAGQALGQANTNDAVLDLSGSMVGSSGFKANDLFKNGWWTNKGTKKGNRLIGTENSMLAFQNHALGTGVENADKNQDSSVMSNFVGAFGGFLPQEDPWGADSNMPAVDYGFMSDYLTHKKRQAERSGNFAVKPQNTVFAEGGDKSAARQLAEGWYNSTVGGAVALGDAIVDTTKRIFRKGRKPSDTFNGSGATSRWKPAYRPKNAKNFNEAFDEAKDAGAETFMFGDKEYSTIMEANPFREINNRYVGAGRTEDLIRRRKGYGKDFGPIGGTYSLLPFVPYAFGGDMQAHGGDFGTGLSHVNAGGSHEENPYDGVQMGVDPEGTPNLVEEGEVIFNDYVYSRRILLDEETKKKFHFPKKKDLTFADAAKKLEKEISERPNDPISKAGFKAQMEILAEEQERQKQEMEAQRAEEAFNALSDEEKVAVMQEAAAREEQAAQEQVTAEEQAMAQQASPEEAGMMEGSGENTTEMQGEVPADAAVAEGAVEQPMMAYGGNLFDIGGLAWIKKNHPEIKNPNAVAKALEAHMQANKGNFYRPNSSGIFGNYDDTPYWQFELAWSDLMPATTSLSSAEKHFNKWLKAGLDKETAFSLTHSDSIYNQYMGKNREEKKREYDAAYKRLVTDAEKASSKKQNNAIRWRSADPNDTKIYATEHEAKVASANYHSAQTKAQQAAAAKQETPKETATVAPTVPVTKETRTEAKSEVKAAQGTKVVQPKVVTSNSNKGDIVAHKYNWYRNGSDGYSQPWGFTVGSDGLIDTESGYTDEYRDLVSTLGAKDIKDWAVAHLEDPSLQSFLARNYNGSLDAFIADDKFTDDMWRKGATDGKYGFMHHVGSSMLKDKSILDELGIDENALAKSEEESRQFVDGLTRTPRVYHALEGDDDYIQGELDPNVVGDPIGDPVKLPNGDTVIYHARKIPVTDAGKVVTDPQTGERRVVPVLRDERLRYAGLFGPAVGLGMQLAGVGKPDYSRLDAAVENAGNVHIANYKPIGNYLSYSPMDIWAEQNRMDANARATDRALLNSTSPARNAGILANAYNNQLASSELYRKALEYNDAKRQQVAAFNRGTDQYNSQAFNQNSMFNATAMNQAERLKSQMAMQAAGQRMQGDASWYNSIYGNVAGIFKGLSDLGRENAEHNRLAGLIVSGAIPGVNPENAVFSGYAKYGAEGGKIQKKRKKKGLTV